MISFDKKMVSRYEDREFRGRAAAIASAWRYAIELTIDHPVQVVAVAMTCAHHRMPLKLVPKFQIANERARAEVSAVVLSPVRRGMKRI